MVGKDCAFKIEALKQKKHFLELKESGIFLSSKLFVVRFVPKKNSNTLYYGIIITKKLGNSVVRNKLRRRLLHILRICLNKQQLTSGHLLIVCKRKSPCVVFSFLQKEFINVIFKINRFKMKEFYSFF